jgi:hypothetical protein
MDLRRLRQAARRALHAVYRVFAAWDARLAGRIIVNSPETPPVLEFSMEGANLARKPLW